MDTFPSRPPRDLLTDVRSENLDVQLGLALAAIAGAVNAGGFIAVGHYTSHMSGIVSAMADNLTIGKLTLVAVGLVSLAAFVAGAASSAILIKWGGRSGRPRKFALPLLAEAWLLLLFGLAGALESHGLPSVLLLCFIMGLQNAVITKISQARIRTTHVTGMVTDLGIELGKLLYWNRSAQAASTPVIADRGKMRLHGSMLASFFTGGLVGALGFATVGSAMTVPIAAILLFIVFSGRAKHESA